jgi:drug/metabolite transporter (DMT)-like permease
MKNEKLQAMILMFFSCLSFSLMQIFVRLSSGSVPLTEQVFFRNLIGLFIAAAVLRIRKISPAVIPGCRLALFIRSLFGFIGVFFLFYASAHARQADVSLLSRTSAVWVFIFQFFLGQKMTRTQVWVVILCLIGSVIAINPRFDSPVIPLLCACATSVCGGAGYTAIGYCRGKVDAFVVIFYFCLFSTLCAGIMMLRELVIPSGMLLAWLLLIGICAAAGQITLTYGLMKATAGVGSIYEYFSIIISAALGYLCFGEPLALTTVIGSVFIVSGTVWNYLESRRLAE